jgi:hypothetical protein
VVFYLTPGHILKDSSVLSRHLASPIFVLGVHSKLVFFYINITPFYVSLFLAPTLLITKMRVLNWISPRFCLAWYVLSYQAIMAEFKPKDWCELISKWVSLAIRRLFFVLVGGCIIC